MAVLIGLLFAAAVALRGHMPGPRTVAAEPASDNPASLAGVIALLGVSLVVMTFAAFARRPPRPKAAPFEIPDVGTGGGGRLNRRLLVLIALGLVVVWLAVFVAVSQFRMDLGPTGQTAAPTTTSAPSNPPQPTATAKPRKAPGDTYRVLAGATGVLLVLMVVSTVVVGMRNRAKPPSVVVTPGPPADAPAPSQRLAVAAERGLAEVANLSLEPREAIIACYAAMERALAGTPAAPQASDTPSEVLARAVGNHAISDRGAATLVDLFAEARFSRHTMTEEHRDEAQRALRSVLDELRSVTS